MVPIRTPIEDITRHVIQTVAIGWCHRGRYADWPFIGRQTMGLAVSWKAVATFLAFGFLAAMLLGMV
jgi:hypothetical protein